MFVQTLIELARPVYQTIIKFIRNPIYAGAYAFGRTETHTRVLDGLAHKVRGYRRAREQVDRLLRDHHEGYIGREEYERNQRQLADSAQMTGLMVRGAVRRGPSRLAPLLRCGRKLHVAYSGSRGQVPRYHCRGGAVNHGAASCISLGGLHVDEAIGREVVAVLTRRSMRHSRPSPTRPANTTN